MKAALRKEWLRISTVCAEVYLNKWKKACAVLYVEAPELTVTITENKSAFFWGLMGIRPTITLRLTGEGNGLNHQWEQSWNYDGCPACLIKRIGDETTLGLQSILHHWKTAKPCK
jgi:hypothetical protein